jgi:uncharacterized membrane protein
MKPYRNIQSKHLPLLLLLARVLVYLSLLFFVLATAFAVFTMGVYALLMPNVIATFAAFTFAALLLSGLMAAVVAFEESYRLRTEHLLRASVRTD